MYHFIIIDHAVLLLLVNAHRMPSRIKNQKRTFFNFSIKCTRTRLSPFSRSLFLWTTERSRKDLFESENMDLHRTLHQMPFDMPPNFWWNKCYVIVERLLFEWPEIENAHRLPEKLARTAFIVENHWYLPRYIGIRKIMNMVIVTMANWSHQKCQRVTFAGLVSAFAPSIHTLYSFSFLRGRHTEHTITSTSQFSMIE